MNATTKQQLMDRVIRAIERDSRSFQTVSSDQLRQTTDRIVREVRLTESTFQRASQIKKTSR